MVRSCAPEVMTSYLSDLFEADMQVTCPAFVDTAGKDAIPLR